jgi:NhaP-type Na+/H+ or K+/H+ antiporter
VPARVRQSLNVESGLNDGLIVPLVAVLMACAAGEESSSQWTWIVHGLKAVGYGVGLGALVGVVSAKLLDKAEDAGWMHSGARRVAVAAVPITAYLVAELFHGSGFLAAFIGGLAMGSTTKHLERHLYDFTEDAGELLGVVTWIAFGVLLFPAALTYATPAIIGYALLSLTVIRMVPVALSLIGMGFHSYTVLFIGWFGPRGLASVVFAITVAGREDIPGAATIAGVAMWTILLSVLLHGMTASWLARAYGARVTREDDADVHEFPAPRSRRS